MRGNASDRGCSAGAATRRRPGSVRRVSVSIALKVGKRCRFVSAKGTLVTARSCTTAQFVTARGKRRWRREVHGSFPAGTYEVAIRARDAAGNRERTRIARLLLR